MATTVTPRLGLKKQAAGDNPGTWNVDLNAGFDDADAKFFRAGTDDPNIAETADFIGQRYHRTTDDYWWTATATGSPGTWVSDFAIIDADVNHPVIPTTLPTDYPHGHLVARLSWLSTTEVQLRPVGGNTIYYDSSGTRVNITGDFVFDITTDREAAQTLDPGIAYYLYLDNDTTPGTPLPVVSKTVPFDMGTAKPGYHPTLTDHRCVGSIWFNLISQISKFTAFPGGRIIFDSNNTTGDFFILNLTLTGQAALRSRVLNVPKTALSCRLHAMFHSHASQDGYMVIAKSDATMTVSAQIVPFSMVAFIPDDPVVILQQNTNRSVVSDFDMIIADRTAPAFKYGHDNSLPKMFEVKIVGYTDLWAPRNY